MSHQATNWAFEQPQRFSDMKPSEWAVLIVLADCHNPLKGCFPSQEYIAERTNIDARSVRRHLVSLRNRHLLNWDEIKEKGRKISNRYYLEFEDKFEPFMPKSPEDKMSCGDTPADAENQHFPEDKMSGGDSPTTSGQNQPFPEDKINTFQRTKCPPNPVREPVREPLCGEDGSGEPQREDLKKKEKEVETAFWRVVKDWPGFAGMPKEKARTAWFKLDDDERALAERRRDGWFALLRSHKKSHTPAPSTYFSEKLFADVCDKPEPPKPPVDLAAFGKGWIALRMHLLDQPRANWQPTAFLQSMIDAGKGHLVVDQRRNGQFPKVARMDEDASHGRGVRLAPDFANFDTDSYVAVKVGSGEWDAWQGWHEAMDYPLLPEPPDRDRHAWLPSMLPPALPEHASEQLEGDHHAFG